MNRPRILVVDDDPSMLRLCQAVIQRQGWLMASAQDGGSAEELLATRSFELVVLDLNLPDGDGLDIGRRLYQQGVPFLLMTARDQPNERLAGFEVGAADYLTKPFHPDELVHRIRRVLNLQESSASTANDGQYQLGAWQFDPVQGRLSDHNGRRIGLTMGESRLLAALLAARGRVVERDRLLQTVARSDGAGHYRTVDVLISRLRKKLEDDPRHPALIVTVTGTGYRLTGEQP